MGGGVLAGLWLLGLGFGVRLEAWSGGLKSEETTDGHVSNIHRALMS